MAPARNKNERTEWVTRSTEAFECIRMPHYPPKVFSCSHNASFREQRPLGMSSSWRAVFPDPPSRSSSNLVNTNLETEGAIVCRSLRLSSLPSRRL